jgi:hypothetical protein
MARPPRYSLIPNANNVRLLGRLIELVAQGVRDPRVLANVLDCEVRTTHYYTQAGDWLRLLQTDEKTHEPYLTRLGLEWTYAGKDRGRVYARAVWQVPFVRQLMQGRTELPNTAVIAQFIQQCVPDMAKTTARRRATAVRRLIEPAMKYPALDHIPGHQLALDLGMARPRGRPEPIDQRAAAERNPAAYRAILRALLDHGELSLWHIRALLDARGGQSIPVAPYVDQALNRGDAWRVGDRLVVSWGAVWRRELAETVAGVALSDPGYREYLRAAVQAAKGHPGAAMDYSKLQADYASWDQVVFGRRVAPAEIPTALDHVLLGRPLDAYPLADDPGPEPGELTGAFLDLTEAVDLVMALPTTLEELVGGISRANELLEERRKQEGGPPSIVDRRELVHGGLFFPGEPRSRVLPDTVTLRYRALSHVPHLAMITGLLILHRRSQAELRLRMEDGVLTLRLKRRKFGDVLFVLDEFCSMQGWLVSRRVRGGLAPESLCEVLEALGVALRIGDLLVLDEAFFLRLQTDVEDRQLYDRLLPLGQRLVAFLDEL